MGKRTRRRRGGRGWERDGDPGDQRICYEVVIGIFPFPGVSYLGTKVGGPSSFPGFLPWEGAGLAGGSPGLCLRAVICWVSFGSGLSPSKPAQATLTRVLKCSLCEAFPVATSGHTQEGEGVLRLFDVSMLLEGLPSMIPE